jgi:hypothetical protein
MKKINNGLQLTNLFLSIHTLFRSDEQLQLFLFHHQNRELRLAPDALLQEARSLCRGEKILIQIALDFWSESGGARLPEIIENLDHDNFIAFVRALLRIRGIDNDSFHALESECYD